MILALPRRAANDNPAREFWTCFECNNGAFLLESVEGVTTIHCAVCNIDVTGHITPHLAVSVDLQEQR